MIRVLIAAAVGLALSVGFGPRFIDFLRRNEFGQHIREEGPQHFHKQGIPTMGGLLILFAATVAFLPVSHYRLQALTVLFTALACGAIGFLDDFIKLTHKRSLGLSGRWKLLLLAGVTVVVAIVARHLHLSTDVYIPVIDVTVPLSYGWYVFLFFVIAGAANGTNLADGVDGLLAGTGIIALFTFMAMNVVSYVRSGPAGHRNLTKLDLAIVGAALIGAAVGFLWFNAFPAEVIMGDTGSMAFGGALAAFAIMMKVEVLLIFIGGIFVIEALSVMIQVFSFKRFGRRVFLMAPIHHHFEMKAWSETKITVRFWIIGGPAVRGRVRALLPLLLRSEPAVSAGVVEVALLDAARLEPDDDVLVLDGPSLALGAHERVGDGWVYVVRSQVDELEELLGEAHAVGASGVAYLVGETPVLPLPDGAVAAAVGRIATEDGALEAAAEELARVLSSGGRASFAEPDAAGGEALARALAAAGFEQVEAAHVGEETVVSGRLG